MKFLLLCISIFVVKIYFSQLTTNNKTLEIKGLFNLKDSSVLLVAKNISNSTILLNDSEKYYVDVNDYFVSSISLISNGISILEPYKSDKMLFKRLTPNSTCSFFLKYNNNFRKNNIQKKHYFFIDVQFIPIKENLYLCDGIYNEELVKFIKDEKLTVLNTEIEFKIGNIEECDFIELIPSQTTFVIDK